MTSTNLLIVEDEDVSLKVLQAFLKNQPFTLFIARNGIEATELLHQHPSDFFQCIISDINMPQKSGLELLAEIKQDDKRKHIPVILQTAASSEEDIKKGIELGAFYYLLKPATQETLLSLITAALKDYENFRETSQSLHQSKTPSPLLTKGQFTFKTLKEAKNLANFLALMTTEPETLAMGFLELMINAIEHGNLEITYNEKTQLISNGELQNEINRRLNDTTHQNKFVTVDLEMVDHKLCVTIKDMGKGFDFKNYMDFSIDRMMDNHGRGIMMANKLSFDQLNYQNNGNTVTCITSKIN